MEFLKLSKLAFIGLSVFVYIAIPTFSVPVTQLERVKGELRDLFGTVNSISLDTNDAAKTTLEFYHRLLKVMQGMYELQENIFLNEVSSVNTENKFKWTQREEEHERFRRDVNEEYPDGGSKCTPDGGDCTKLLTPYCMGQCLLCPPGATGPPGPPGTTGAPGYPGPAGRDGRDALDIRTAPKEENDVTPVEDSQKSFKPPPLPINENNAIKSGVVYVRWGRRQCPSTSDMVYQGIAGGANFIEKGSGSNYLCLPDEPIYHQPDTISNKRGHVYAGEYETLNFGTLADIHQRDVPCVVCMAMQRPSLLMIPARNICPNTTWTLEYSGFIMAANSNHYRTEYVCVDLNAQVFEGTTGHDNGALFYPVEGKCQGGLPCAPYVDGYELTCAVCTM